MGAVVVDFLLLLLQAPFTGVEPSFECHPLLVVVVVAKVGAAPFGLTDAGVLPPTSSSSSLYSPKGERWVFR